MAAKRTINKSTKPNNLVMQAFELEQKIRAMQRKLPDYLRDYAIFLRGSVAMGTRHAYLVDILFFFEYLLEDGRYTSATRTQDISLDELKKLRARDINEFLGDYARRYYKEVNGQIQIYENNNRSLSRKKSSLSSMFKFMFRNEQLDDDITPGLNPIKLPNRQPDSIKRLHRDELEELLEVLKTGQGLTDRERIYWEKTKLRDRAIILLFVTYGLRLRELANLDLGSFNFQRREFTIFRKRDKESIMPLNQTTENAIQDYIKQERGDFTSEDALFLSLQGTRLTERAIRNLVKKYTSIAMQTSRKQGYSPHKLRATAASTLIERGFSIYDVQNLLDHDNVTTTQLYAAHRKNVREDIIENFELDED